MMEHDPRQHPIFKLWRAIIYMLWLPLGTSDAARDELQEVLECHEGFVYMYAEDCAKWGKRIRARDLASLVVHQIGQDALIAAALFWKLGADREWVYRLADPFMVFLALPTLFVLAGFAVAGSPGAVLAGAVLGAMWLHLVYLLRSSTGESGTDNDGSRSLLTLPNVLSMGRLAALSVVPLLVAEDHHLRAAVFLAAIAATDWADGFIARHYGLRTRFGEMMDPTADRLLVVTVVACMMAAGYLNPLLGWVLLTREGVTLLLALAMFRPSARGKPPRAQVHWTGKVGFATTATSLVVLLAVPPSAFAVASPVAHLALVGALIFSSFALGNYIREAVGESHA